MGTCDILKIDPTELKFPFELKKQSSCSMQLINKTNQYVAFKVKTTNPKKYCVRPNSGIVLPASTCSVTVTMQAPKEPPPEMQCKDKFLVQAVGTPDGATTKEITPEMFNKENGRIIEEFKLRVIYIPANPPSPVPEGSDEGYSPKASVLENGNQNITTFDAVSRSPDEHKQHNSEEAWSIISKLNEEKASAIQQNQKLHEELDLMRKKLAKSRGAGGFSLLFVLLVGLLGALMGYVIKKTQ